MIRKIKRVLPLFLFGWLILGLAACSNSQAELPFNPVNIEIQGEGIVIVRESDLERMGVRFPETGGMSVRWNGQEVPAWMLEMEDVGIERSVVFYATPSDSRYSPIDTYQLISVPEALPKLEPLPPGFGATESPVKTWIRLEEDLVYESLSTSESHFLWKTITSNLPFQTSFTLNGVEAKLPAQVTLALRKRGAVDKHTVEVKINGRSVKELSWEGEPEFQFDLQIPTDFLFEQENTIQLDVRGENADQMVVDLDWLEIHYFQGPMPGINFLQWQAESESQNLGGWQGLTITIATSGGEGWIAQAGPGGVVSYTTTPGRIYVTADESGWKYPRYLRPVHTTASLEKGFSGADYIILTPPIWHLALEPLADYYRNEGLKPTIATLDAIYDRYSNGQVDPSAIQAYLQDALNRWEIPPKYALLVGDFDYNPAELADSGAYLPAFFVSTQFGGETVSDYPFSLDDNGQPTIAIGRWPVKNQSELQKVLNMTIGSKSSQTEDLKILSIIDPSDELFTQTYEVFRRLVEAGNQSSQNITFNQADPEIPPTENFQLLVYFGHGSLTAWANPTLMDASIFREDWKNIPDMILQFTCLTSYFVVTDQNSLSEEFLQAGVPIVVGPTSLSLQGDQWPMVEGWARAISDPQLKRVGDMLKNVWETMPLTSESIDVKQTYLLFGDPAYEITWKILK